MAVALGSRSLLWLGGGLRAADAEGPYRDDGFLERPGDLMVVFSTGAYGMVMASRYNSMPLPAEVLVEGRSARVIRRRERYDDLTAHEREPAAIFASAGRQAADRKDG